MMKTLPTSIPQTKLFSGDHKVKFLCASLLMLALCALNCKIANAQTFYYGTGSVASNPYSANIVYGTGVNANNATISGTVSIPAGTYYFQNLTISSAAVVTVSGGSGPLVIYCTGTCTVNGTLAWNGSNGVAGTGTGAESATNGAGAATNGWGTAGGNGGGGATAATNGSTGTSFGSSTGAGLLGAGTTVSFGGGGGGGEYTSTNATGGATVTGNGAGGNAGTAYTNAGATNGNGFPTTTMTVSGFTTFLLGGSGGGGGGNHGGTSANRRTGGGGGGGGGAIQIAAETLTFVGSGIITANGGNGGNGYNLSSLAGGGGGGGSGGTIYLQYLSSNYAAGNANVNGGTDGSGGTGGANGGNGSNGEIFTQVDVTACSPAPSQVTGLTATPSGTTANLSWTNGSEDGIIIMARVSAPVNNTPVSGAALSTYGTASTAYAFGTGAEQVGVGNYVVYAGTGTSTTVTGLVSGTDYQFAVYSYYNSGPCYNPNAVTGEVNALTYSSSATTQVTGNVTINTTNNEVMGVQVVVTGNGLPNLNLSSLTFSTAGTTLASDISNARVFYTGTTGTFATTTQFGSTIANPNGTFTITGVTALASGTNYFWLAYDVPTTATASDLLYGNCTSITVGGAAYTPGSPSPTGNLTVNAGTGLPVLYFSFEDDVTHTNASLTPEDQLSYSLPTGISGASLGWGSGTGAYTAGGAGTENGGSASGVCLVFTGFATGNAPAASALPASPTTGFTFTFSTIGLKNLTLYYQVQLTSTRDNVYVTTNGGTTWTAAYNATSGSASWTQRTITLPAVCNNSSSVTVLIYGSNSSATQNPNSYAIWIDNFDLRANSTTAVSGGDNITLCNFADIWTGYTSGLTGSLYIYDDFAVSGIGTTVNLSACNLGLSGNMYITNSGTLNFGSAGSPTYVLAEGNAFYLNNGGTIGITDNSGITPAASGAVGNVQSTGTRNFLTSGNYTYMGGAAQITGSGLPAVVEGLTINNSHGVTLTNSAAVIGTLGLTSGVLTLGTDNLTLGTNASISGTPSVTNMVADDGGGQFIDSISTTTNNTYTYPVGDAGPDYVPVTLSFATNSTAGTVGVKVINSTEANMNNSSAPAVNLSRYWTLSNTGLTNYTYTGTFIYPEGSVVNPPETGLKFSQWNTSTSMWDEDDAGSAAASGVLSINSALNQGNYPLTGDITGRAQNLGCSDPSTAATNFAFSNLSANGTNSTGTISFTRGNGTAGVVVVASQDASPTGTPPQGNSYSCSGCTAFGSGTAIGNGYIVYVGTTPGDGVSTQTVNLTSLTSGHSYHFTVYEWNTGNCYSSTPLSGGFCIGAPASETSSPASSSACQSVAATYNLSIPAYTDPTYYTYLWEYSATSGGPYTGNTGQITIGYTTPGSLPSSPTYYVCQVTCSSDGSNSVSSQDVVQYNPFYDCNCAGGFGYYNISGSAGIVKTVLNGNTVDLSNTMPAPNNSNYPYTYTFVGSPNPDLTTGATYTANLTMSTGGSNTVDAWIDYDHSGTFETNDALGLNEQLGPEQTNINANAIASFTFQVPGTALLGMTGMRVSEASGVTGITGCGSNSADLGETIDYVVNIGTCSAPTTQASNPGSNTVVSNGANSTCNLTFTRGNGSGGFLVVVANGSAPTPPSPGNSYSNPQGNITAGGSTTAAGSYVIYNSNAVAQGGTVTVPVSGLTNDHTYYFAGYEWNSTSECYDFTSPPAGSVMIPQCQVPATQATGFSLGASTTTTQVLNWSNNGNPDGSIIVMKQGSAPAAPALSTAYTADPTNTFGNNTAGYNTAAGSYVVYKGSGTSVTVQGLVTNTVYDYAIYTWNALTNCYNLTSPITGSFTTVNSPMQITTTITQASVANIIPGQVNQAILEILVTGNTGTAPAYTISNLTFTTAAVNGGTTNPADISKARVWSTGSSSTFATSGAGVSQYGSDFLNPSGSFSITGSQTLSPGANYFWLVYDISDPTVGDYVDAAFTTINSTSVAGGDPAGNRLITIPLNTSAFFGSGMPILYYSFESSVDHTTVETTPEQVVNPNGTGLIYSGTDAYEISGNGVSWGGPASGVQIAFSGWETSTTPITTGLTNTYPSHYAEFDISTVGFKTLTLYYEVITQGSSYPYDEVIYSPDGGTTWDFLQSFTGHSYNSLTNPLPAQRSITLPTSCENNPNLKIRIVGYHSSNTDNPNSVDALIVDDVTLFAYSTVPNAGTFNMVDFIDITNGMLSETQPGPNPTVWIYDYFTVNGPGTTLNMYPSNTINALSNNQFFLSGGLYVTNGGTLNLGSSSGDYQSYVDPAYFSLYPNSTIGITDVNGISAADAIGNIPGGARYFSSQGNYNYIENYVQNTGDGLPSSVNNLTIDDSLGVILSNSVSVNGTLSLTRGILAIESNDITLASGGTLAGAPFNTNDNNYVKADGTGQYIQDIGVVNSNTTFTFPVGDITGSAPAYNYTPVTLTFSSSSAAGSVGVNVTNSTETNMDNPSTPADYLTRYWTFSNSGLTNYSYTGTFAYPGANIAGTETAIQLSQWTGSVWTQFSGSSAASNLLTESTSLTQTTGPLTGDFTGRTASTGVSTWIGPANSDWGTATNWSPTGVPNSCAATVVINSGSPVISTSGISVGNITFGAGATLTLDRQNLSVCGTWTGGSSSAASVTGTGTVIINGTNGAQTISGNTQIAILEISNTNGVSLATNAEVDIATGLWLASGTFTVSAGTLKLLSTSSTANSYIDDFSFGANPGTISGNIIADRYVPIVGSNQHYVSSPVNAPAFSQLNATGPDGDYVVPLPDCDETNSASGTPYGTVFQYNDGHEASGGCMLGNWQVRSAGNTENGRGYSVYLTGNSTQSLKGTANTGDLSIGNLNNSGFGTVNTLQGDPIESGWNLVGNPYPSALNLTVDRTGDGFGDQVQLWQTSGAYAGSWQSAVITENGLQTGEDEYIEIAPFQAFMVRTIPVLSGGVTGMHTFNFHQSERVRTTTVPFYRTESQNTLILSLDYNGMQDLTKVSFNPSATNGFDPAYDADKSDGSAGRPTLYTYLPNQNMWYSINTLPSLTETTAVPMGLRPENNGTMTISAQEIESFDPTTYIYLEDTKTGGAWENLRNGAYTFTTTTTDNQQRFVLHFTPPAIILTQDASCETSGMINIEQPGSANWNYSLTDNNNATISSGVLNQSSPLNISVPVGVYTLTLTDNNGYTVVKNIQVSGTQQVTAAFSSSLNTAQVLQNITFTGNTPDAAIYNWNFGDGATAVGSTATHSFQQAGVYNVVLNVNSAAGCTSSTTHPVVITSRGVTGVTNVSDAGNITIWSNENRVYIDFSKLSNVDADISMYDVLGQLINHEQFGRSTIYSRQIDNIEAAYIIVKVVNDSQITTRKVFILNK